jgi:hypothetical protein
MERFRNLAKARNMKRYPANESSVRVQSLNTQKFQKAFLPSGRHFWSSDDWQLLAANKKPTAPSGGWVVGVRNLYSKSSPSHTPASRSYDSSTYTLRE